MDYLFIERSLKTIKMENYYNYKHISRGGDNMELISILLVLIIVFIGLAIIKKFLWLIVLLVCLLILIGIASRYDLFPELLLMMR